MPATLNLMTTGAVAKKYGISITSVNYAINNDKVRSFKVDSGNGRSLFLVDPESADKRWGAEASRPNANTALPSEAECVVRRADKPGTPPETTTLARVSQDASLLNSGGIVVFQDENQMSFVAVHASNNIGALLLNASVNAPTVRPLFIQLSDDPAKTHARFLKLLEPYADDDVPGVYSAQGAVKAIFELGFSAEG